MNNKFIFGVWIRKISLVYKNSSRKISTYKNSNYGKRCFIIGNGPSLTYKDLEKLKYEYTFATNMIFKIFEETDWRPTYYLAQDYTALKQLYNSDETINKLSSSLIFLPIDIKNLKIKYSNRIKYFYIYRKSPFPKAPKFSSDVSKIVFEGGTVTYSAIQLATYLGFKEIYLLGVDNNYSYAIMPDGKIIKNSALKDYFTEYYNTNEYTEPVNLAKPDLAFRSAKQYCEDNEIKIYNATRGGKLEIFNRIRFDDMKFTLK